MEPNGKIYIVDDDEAVRHSLGLLLDITGFSIASFSSGVEFLRHAKTLAPGCLILDVRMPDMDGLELQSRLAELKVSFPVIMMTGHGDVPLAVRAMKAGAVDFIEKPFAEDTILASIRLAQNWRGSSRARDESAEVGAARLALLSRRESEVLEGVVGGLSNKSIAFELGLSPRTVEIHRARVMDKMQARNLSELVRLALATGITIRSGP